MKWRALATVLVGLLLTVPLGALFVSASRPPPLVSPGLEQRNVAPMLSQAQRGQLSTWRQPCRRSDDCDSPLVCFADVNLGGFIARTASVRRMRNAVTASSAGP